MFPPDHWGRKRRNRWTLADRSGMMRAMVLDFYYDIVCPYAYLASTRIEALAARCGAELRWRPLLLGGIFRNVGGDQVPMHAMSAPRARLNLLDMHRWAAHWGVPLTMPGGHPRRSVDAMRLCVAADDATRPALSRALFRAYWVDGRDIDDRAVLGAIAAEHGLDADVVGRPTVRQGLFDATAEAAERGVFGVPAFHVDGRLFWGQDRLGLVEAALGGAPEPYVPRGDGGARIRFFHDFASPFSYLASTQVERVAAEHGATLEWAPILLGGLFRAIGTPDVPLFQMSATKRRYVARDLEDWAKHWGVPYRFPSHFPMRSILPLRVALAEPRLTPRLYRAAWSEDRRVDDPAHLAALIEEAGFEPEPLLKATADPALKARLRAHTDAARAAGACGVPSFEVRHGDGPPMLLWGQDRIPMLRRVLDGWRPDCG